MRAAIRSVLVVISIAVTVFAGRSGVTLMAVNNAGGNLGIASVLPMRGALVGVAHPVVIIFGNPVADRQAVERAIDVRSAPARTGKFEWLDDNVVQWVPDRFWPAHSTVALSVGGLRTNFETGPAVVGVADIAKHTFTVSIDGVPAGTGAPTLPTPHHRPHWGEEGVLPASMGRPEFETPVGTYHVISKDRTVIMDSSSVGIPVDDPDGYRLPVDYAVRITSRGLYVHSAPWAIRSMGIENVSHGCISLSPTDAEWYFNTVNVGDPVIVQEGVPADEKEVDPVIP
ncbi:L,D-transpeptidase catalytic domain protein [Mycobacterium kansasii 732]|uniref:Putative L,D-transpeptidase 3 n=1 Tax=Mycobacterium pseudokansasii TaxID=2341080 RepID=A0A498QK23_9MYCO|nr:L,D-transpeptidase family protein [Mycobacterium pseudokansasii]EUA15229.1 L,D-transpeptidase catalytic domain protein [Mycobacterium kansasii 732]MBY0388012.1 L,D-transpeptidase family protein [Mycobacterium pseudokansasii]VAZ91007.1 putative L,D-transpeptidase 3 [Mycobacterium pseudokansasii]VAZ91910.1 putative L,D-transpeptidase 3 [Mycobacterium pseudokansasii]VBA48397.1 putative L,D-transpeptidase 3 [Mycobacterium pseudokansasii]